MRNALAILAGLADALGILDRSKFGLDYGERWGFKPAVTLRIQVEALAEK